MNQREMAFVNVFITAGSRDTAARTLARRSLDPKARSKFHRWLAGQITIEPTLATDLNTNVSPSDLLALIESDGPTSWWVVSTTSSDATEVTSEVAIGELLDGAGPVILCDEWGAMAMYGTEFPPGNRYLLRAAGR